MWAWLRCFFGWHEWIKTKPRQRFCWRCDEHQVFTWRDGLTCEWEKE